MRRSILKIALFSITGYSALVGLGFSPPGGVDQVSRTMASVAPYKNWGLASAEALSAWKIEEGSKNVVVAVIDTGIDPKHKSLAKNLWHDPHSAKGDVFGWNFTKDDPGMVGSPNPTDDHGHGTHVAGIIGAIADPANGVSGIAHRVSIMPVKYFSENSPGTVNLRNTIRALNYAVEHGARIINYSGGGPEPSEDEYLAIKKAEARGVLVVAAAGNDHHNVDLSENYYYPSAYDVSNIISVAAIDIQNNLLKSSNWGKRKVDVAAPGDNIYSTLPNGRFGYMSGTSQATAFVTGVAALLLADDPTLTPTDLKRLIRASVDRLPQLQDKVFTGGRVNAYSALMALKNRGRFDKTKPALIAQRPSSLMRILSSPGFEN